MISAVASEVAASEAPHRLSSSRAVWRAARDTVPALPIDLYRAASGALLLVENLRSLAWHEPASGLDLAVAAGKMMASALIIAGVWPRASAFALLITLAWLSRAVPRTGMDDYMSASTCFWLWCLPVGRSLGMPWHLDALAQARSRRVPDLARQVFVLWIASVCFFGVLCDVAWRGWIPEQVRRTLTGLLLASLLWPPRSFARYAGALVFGTLVLGLFARLGPRPGVLFLLPAALLVWAPELPGRIEVSAHAGDEGAIEATGVLSVVMFVLFALSILPGATAPARRAAVILRDVGLNPDLAWGEQPLP